MATVALSTPIQPARMPLKPDERTFIVGMTGSGKSVMARYIDRLWARAGWQVLIIDQDDAWEIEGMTHAEKPEDATVEHPWNITRSGRLHPTARVQIFIPLLPGWDDSKFLILMEECFNRGNIVLHFDELYGVIDNQHVPTVIRKLWSGGRKRHVVILALTQRPVDIPKVVVNQAEVKMMFLLLDPDDRDRMANIIGDPQVAREQLPRYWHWYWRVGMTKAEKRGPLPQRDVK